MDSSSPEKNEDAAIEQRHPIAVFLVMAAILFGGAGIGIGMANLLAPASDWASFVSFLSLPASFLLGLTAWKGLLIVTLLWRFLPGVSRSRSWNDVQANVRATAEKHRGEPIPGTWVFVPIPTVLNGLAGLLVAIGLGRFLQIVPAYLAVGFAYGYLVHRLARSGYIIPGDEA